MAVNVDQVDHASSDYEEMRALWKLPDDLLGGTKRMRENAAEWVPKKEAEEAPDWTARVNAAVLFGGYEKVLEEMAARPFERPVSVQTAAELSEFLAGIEGDADREGTTLTALAADVFREALHRGLTHVLVDFPQLRPGATLDEARRARATPTFVHVQPPRLLGWRHEKDANGRTVLAQVRIYEREEVADGTYGTRLVERVRVYNRQTWEVHERVATDSGAFATATASASGPPTNPGPDADGERVLGSGLYQLVAEGTNPLGEVPLVTLYLTKAGRLKARPVFEAVAHLNLAHFQSDSRQRAYLDFARIGTVTLLGFTAEDAKAGMTWGVNRYIRNEKGPNEARVEVVNHGKEALEAGSADLRSLKEDMEALGLAPLVQRSSTVTATGEVRDEKRGASKAQAWVRDLEACLLQCYQWAARWTRSSLPEDFAIDVFSDFGVTSRSTDEAKLLVQLATENKITVRTLLRELKRRGLFADAFDADQELEAVGEEILAMAPASAEPAPEEPDPDAPADEQDPDVAQDQGAQ